MTTALTFQGHKVRHVTINNDPWFAAIDVVRALGLYSASGVQAHVRKLLPDERQIARKGVPLGGHVTNACTLFGFTDSALTIISESGLYKLTMRADAKLAEPFQDWVTREVLPSIRKTGSYSTSAAMSPQSISRPLKLVRSDTCHSALSFMSQNIC